MAKIASNAALLHAALQDIHAGLRDQATRIPDEAVDAALRAILARERDGSAHRAAALEAGGLNPAGPDNLWMKGVLDDAGRDAKHTQTGCLLDIALAGAIRKGKAAEVVACDTALALLDGDDEALAPVVADIQAQARTAERQLLEVIRRLA